MSCPTYAELPRERTPWRLDISGDPAIEINIRAYQRTPSVLFSPLKGGISKQILSIRRHRCKALYAMHDTLGGRLDENCFPDSHPDADSFGYNYGDTGSHRFQEHYRLNFI